MTKRNPDYDFRWCPGCGDFGVVRAIELALADRVSRLDKRIEETAIVAGIGCSGNLVHLQEGPQPFGIHGIHGRTLPIAWGLKASRPDVNVLVVAGDGDFLSIGAEHIGPQAKRNLDIAVVVMDNGVYGLTKGQASPTTALEVVTPTTPYGKLDDPTNPLEMYIAMGVEMVISGLSSRPRDLARDIAAVMEFPGFAIVHVQSPCTTYNDTYEALKGNPETGLEPAAYALPEDHDPTDATAAMAHARSGRIPLGLLYQRPDSVPMHERLARAKATHNGAQRSVEQMLVGFEI
jgi:2-oxoglutarate ferredoxin oxidoreductase subunit beta